MISVKILFSFVSCIILFFIGKILFSKEINDINNKIGLICVCFVLWELGVICGMSYLYKFNEPKAIDVYRGNTKLEITYTVQNSDTIKTDTVVIFKK